MLGPIAEQPNPDLCAQWPGRALLAGCVYDSANHLFVVFGGRLPSGRIVPRRGFSISDAGVDPANPHDLATGDILTLWRSTPCAG